MITFVFVLVGFAVILAVGLAAVGRFDGLPQIIPDRAPDAFPLERPATAADVDAVRFDVGLRGYRMDEVDDLLDRLSVDLADRDTRIAELEVALSGVSGSPTDAAAVGRAVHQTAPGATGHDESAAESASDSGAERPDLGADEPADAPADEPADGVAAATVAAATVAAATRDTAHAWRPVDRFGPVE